MQKLVITSQSVVDSLNNELLALQESIKVLEAASSDLKEDNLNLMLTANEALTKANFFSEHLTAQTALFSAIILGFITLVGLVSWVSIIKPIYNKLAEFENEILPEKLLEMRTSIDEDIAKFRKEFDTLRIRTNDANGWAIRSLYFINKEEAPNLAFLFALRFCKLMVDNIDVYSERLLVTWQDSAHKHITSDLADPDFLERCESEIEEILTAIISCQNLRIRDNGLKIKRAFYHTIYSTAATVSGEDLGTPS